MYFVMQCAVLIFVGYCLGFGHAVWKFMTGGIGYADRDTFHGGE